MGRWSKLAIAILLIISFFPGCKRDAVNDNDTKEEQALSMKFTKYQTTPNPTGMRLSIRQNQNSHGSVLENLGLRTIGRESYTSWKNLELREGVYDIQAYFDRNKQAHRVGETPIISINMSYTGKKKGSIPDFYTDDISDPKTRKAANDFLYAFVQEALRQLGSTMLCIDSEPITNHNLAKADASSAADGRAWSEWYVQAAAVARRAAADLGGSGQLKLIPIINGDPLTEDSLFQSGKQQWLTDVVRASDYLGFDTYHWKHTGEVTDPQRTLDITKFWVDHYAEDKGVIIVEHGFTTVTEHYPDITPDYKNGKYAGTEEQQAEYFHNLFVRLKAENSQNGMLRNKLKGLILFHYRDEPNKEDKWSQYFGIVRKDGTNKAALQTVKQAFGSFETDPYYRPYLTDAGEDVTQAFLTTEAGVQLKYTEGNQFEFLQAVFARPERDVAHSLQIKVEQPGSVIVCINHEYWLNDSNVKTDFTFDITKYVAPGKDNIINMYFTGDKFPFRQKVISVDLIHE
jgi:hypothetical protein